jgi:cold shock CspA family protein
MAQQFNGTIKYVNPSKGFGFIKCDTWGRPDVFFSFDQLRGNAARLPQPGEKVIYEEGSAPRGPVATTVYNMADPWACEDFAADCETGRRLAEAKQLAGEGQKKFMADLIERNRQWHAARMPSAKKDDAS